MKKQTVTVAAVILVVMSFWGTALAQSEAQNGMSWLDGFSLVVLESDDIAGLHRARTEIQSRGGRVAILSPPSLILGWIPYQARNSLIGTAGIKNIYYSEVLPGELVFDDPQSPRMISYFNSVVRGDHQKKLLARASQSAGAAGWPGGHSDALQRPELDEQGYIENLERAGLDVGKLKDRGMLLQKSQAMGNSDAMTGTISVTLFFVESNGGIDPNTYTWTDEHVQDYVDGVNTGLAWWTQRAYGYFDCWNAFLVRYFPPTDVRCQQGYEPVTHTSSFHSTWASAVMTNFGYTSGDIWTKTNAYNTAQKSTYGTDWAYSAFIAYNPPGAPDRFTNGTSAFAYLGGPHTVLLYRSYSWAPEQVFTHETGHIFFACDEYDGGCSQCTNCAGKPHTNCYLCSSFQCMMKLNDFLLCSWTPAQIGWEGLSCAPTPLAPPATASSNPPSGLQGVTQTITLTGTGFVWGADVNMGPDVFVHGTNVINSTTMDVDITPDTDAPVGLVDVIVTNRDLQTDTLDNGWTILQTKYHYASPSGNNIFPYITPADAATTFSDLIGAAADGDSVLVETGTYMEPDSAVVSGGFTLLGAWNSTFTIRDLLGGKSVIDLSLSDSRSILVGTGGQPVVIDGFEVSGGEGSLQSQSTPSGDFGGAIYIDSTPTTVSNCVLTSNVAGQGGNYGAGGAIYANASTVDFHDNVISSNSAGQGGAIFLHNCTGSITGNTIFSNSVDFNTMPAQGGAIYVFDCPSLTLTDNMITGNSATTGIPGASFHGGGIFVTDTSSVTNVTISGGEISYNDADNNGGGLYYEKSTVVVDNVRFAYNTATFGGGVGTNFSGTPTITITDCDFLWNSVSSFGGGVQVTGAAYIDHNLFVGNNATNGAGAGYLSVLSVGSFIGNTLDRNTSASTGGVYLLAAGIPVLNNIVANSSGVGVSCLSTPLPTTEYNNVWNSGTTDYSGCTVGPSSVSGDPEFADTSQTDYHLGVYSPSIDAGDPAPGYNDLDGSRGDMGFYGSHSLVMDQPSYPKDLYAAYDQGDVVLHWTQNPEPDVEWYAVFKDTVDDFVPTSTNFLQLVASSNSMFNTGAFVDTCYYRIAAIDTNGYSSGYSGTAVWGTLTSAENTPQGHFRLYQNHPNPFNPSTVIRYELEERTTVSLVVYDVNGRLIRTLVDESRAAGGHVAEWDGKNSRGQSLSSGIYFYRLRAGSDTQTKKMVLLK